MEKIIFDYLTNYIEDNTVNINYDTELINSGIIDSLAVINLISFLEDKFGIIADENDFELDNFNSVNHIVSFIKNKENV